MNGAYEVHFAAREGSSSETLERIAGIVSFAVIGPRRARGLWRVHVSGSFFRSTPSSKLPPITRMSTPRRFQRNDEHCI